MGTRAARRGNGHADARRPHRPRRPARPVGFLLTPASDPFDNLGTLKGYQTSRDGAPAAKPPCAQRDDAQPQGGGRAPLPAGGGRQLPGGHRARRPPVAGRGRGGAVGAGGRGPGSPPTASRLCAACCPRHSPRAAAAPAGAGTGAGHGNRRNAEMGGWSLLRSPLPLADGAHGRRRQCPGRPDGAAGPAIRPPLGGGVPRPRPARAAGAALARPGAGLRGG